MPKERDITNRNSLRIENQESIISLFRQYDGLSIADISDRLGLSFPAVSNIVGELLAHKVLSVVKEKNEKSKKGRKSTIFSLNTDIGVTAGIDLSSASLSVALFDLKDNLLFQESIEGIDFIEKKHFEQLAHILSSLLAKKETGGKRLLGIVIASPGMINSHSGDYAMAYRIKDYANFNPQNYFANLFSVPTKLYNDVRVGAIAEKLFGSIPSGMHNFLYMHIGTNTGLALFLDDKLYTGTNGYSGEISIYNPIDEISENCRHNKLYSLSRLYSRTKELKGLDENSELDLKKLLAWKENRDPDVLFAIDESAKYNALAIIGYADLLDLEGVILEGPIVALGEEYRNLLLKYINLYDAHEVRIRLLFSNLTQNNNLMGSAYLANSQYFAKTIKEITKKRLSHGKDGISDV